MTLIESSLLALLFSSHLLGDFVFQTRKMVDGKRRSWSSLLAHTVEMAVVQGAVVLLVFPQWRGGLVILGLAFSHFCIDALKVQMDKRWPRPLTWFTLDQLLHFAALLVAARMWESPEPAFDEDALTSIRRWAVIVGVAAFNVHGGSAVVSGLLAQIRDATQPEPDVEVAAEANGAGRLIGILERLLVVFAVMHSQWAAVGLVLTGKSVARFKALEDRDFAEQYLVGTLASVLIAVITGALALAFVS